jgi:PmbA protein
VIQERGMRTTDIQDSADRALVLMRRQGFEHAQVSASATTLTELNVAHNEPSLMRSTEQHKLALLGIVDGRRASTELSDLGGDAVRQRIERLFAEAGSAPRDEANAVSADQRANIVQGPQVADEALLADKMRELLAFRAERAPKFMIDETFAAHTRVRAHTLTSGGSELACSLGWYAMSVVGTARDGQRSSSFNFAGGSSNDLASAHVSEHFGIGEMLRDTERQIDTKQIPAKFVGDVVLMPNAVEDLVRWLHGQIGDVQLIAGSSLYRDKVGERIASPLLTLKSRFDAPGVAAISGDAFATPPVHILREGRLVTLTPSLYGSRKTGLPHVPLASGGWELAGGDTPRDQVIADVQRGALVGRLSMGNPAANGDFSGVIKNSFLIEGGQVGLALSEVMIAGNIARMLCDAVAVSRERIDNGEWWLPWVRIGGLHFS